MNTHVPRPPSIRRPGPVRLAAVAIALVLSMSAAVAGNVSPVSAGQPSVTQETVIRITCLADADFGSVELGLEHISTGAGWPGGDLRLWTPDADPEHDQPVLAGYNPQITRHGTTLTGEIGLRAGNPDGEPGQGIAEHPDDDIVGWATYTVSFAISGPSETEKMKGPIVEYDKRYNQRFRSTHEASPVTGTGELILPGRGPVRLDHCTGREVVQDAVVTAPSTSVGSGRYPFGFDEDEVCEGDGSGNTNALLALAGGQASILVIGRADREVVTVGDVFPTMTRTTMTASLPMFAPDGAGAGDATLAMSLRAIDREATLVRSDAGLDMSKVEVVVAEGTVVFDGETYSFAGCEGIRLRDTTISRKAQVAG